MPNILTRRAKTSQPPSPLYAATIFPIFPQKHLRTQHTKPHITSRKQIIQNKPNINLRDPVSLPWCHSCRPSNCTARQIVQNQAKANLGNPPSLSSEPATNLRCGKPRTDPRKQFEKTKPIDTPPQSHRCRPERAPRVEGSPLRLFGIMRNKPNFTKNRMLQSPLVQAFTAHNPVQRSQKQSQSSPIRQHIVPQSGFDSLNPKC